MKKTPLPEHEVIRPLSLVLLEANRLRKNLCQDLSSLGKNGLHYTPFPKRVAQFPNGPLIPSIFMLAESGDPDVKA